jgi:hypothetical protein
VLEHERDAGSDRSQGREQDRNEARLACALDRFAQRDASVVQLIAYRQRPLQLTAANVGKHAEPDLHATRC